MRSQRLLMLLLPALLLAAPLAAEEVPANILITFDVGNVEDGKDVVLKTYEMIVAADGEQVSMSTGSRIPIPTTSFKVTDDGSKVATPVNSYTYQQVGFLARVRALINHDGSIQLRGSVDDSSLAETPANEGRPFIQSMDQHLSATLTDGKPLRINRVDEAGTRSFFIQVRADRLEGAGQEMAKN